MHFDVQAVPADQFAAWIDAARKPGPSLDAASYAELARQSRNVTPFTFSAVEPDLFERVVTQHLPPGPGPQTGRPNPGVSPRTEE
jgi:cytochrome o ubiquinol oxidase subunit 2